MLVVIELFANHSVELVILKIWPLIKQVFVFDPSGSSLAANSKVPNIRVDRRITLKIIKHVGIVNGI